ncbi:MAG: anaerobic ribonucleoside-triphosphate reductase activating protein [Lachnospiraceae bacterium]|nr:anaerobic ribonucleoside-triphosphate reductase activating protein [Lachnospiraceae bacterium]
MLILGLNKTTLLDYPEHVAATIFTGGCNFRCPFCHNKNLVLPQQTATYTEAEILSFLKKRVGILTGVCITGGEPTLQKDLSDFLARIKDLGYLIKLDTNGYQPDVLHNLLSKNLIDYCAMDIKNSPEKYSITSGLASCDFHLIEESVSCLLSLAEHFPFEFRTTLVREFHNKEDMIAISEWIKGAPAYYLQSYTDSENVITPGYHALSEQCLLEYRDICLQNIPNTQLRGIDL